MAQRFARVGSGELVDAPAFTPDGGGLLDNAEVRPATPAQLRGFYFESELPETALGTVTGFAGSGTAAMAEGAGPTYVQSGDTFTVVAGYALDGPLHEMEEAETRARRRLELGRGLAVERQLWEAGGILPTQATVVRAAPSKAKIALGLLAEWWAASNNGVPYFHAGRRLTNEIAGQQLVDYDASEAQVKGGTALINGAGYFAKTTVAGTTPTADQVWLYISGRPLYYQSPVVTSSAVGIASPTATTSNRVTAFALQTFVPSIDGPIGAVLVDLSL